MGSGFIRLHRKMLDNPVVCKDADHLAIWVWLLLKASWKESDVLFNGKRITLKPGDLPPISRRTIAKDLGISDSKVQRVLKFFENEQQIEQRVNHQSRLISIVSWDKYQESEPPTEPRVNHDRTTSEPRVNTIEEGKKGNNIKKGKKSIGDLHTNPNLRPTLPDVINYIKEKNLNVDGKRFFDFFEAGEWKDSKGNPVKNWKQKLITWSNNNGSKDDARGSESERTRVAGTFNGSNGEVQEVAAAYPGKVTGLERY